MRQLLILAVFIIAPATLLAQQPITLEYYLPSNVQYDSNIPTPQEVLGHEVGEWHVSHDKLVSYMYAIAEASDRVTIQEYARTYENRPLLLLTITSTQNQNRIEEIRKEHLSLSSGAGNNADVSSMPVVVYQGYSIHGNEPSGSNAALLYAYYLAAAQGPEIEQQLENSIVLLDPCFNPDGLNRFANWVNSNKSHHRSPDGNTREHREPWPRGRTNHYWFDLNRDWLPLQHPESQGRIRVFHQWKPNVLTDHHEMGTNSTYFFQPGVPSRTHPLTPLQNQKLTGKIADYHAQALDAIGSEYYTRESFDDFYYGKGSTYPDVNGCVGILFEQASSRGHVQYSTNGTLTFEFTIRNQFTTSLSTWKAAVELKTELLDFQQQFFEDAKSNASKDAVKAYVFGDEFDQTRSAELAALLHQHQVKVYYLNKDIQKNGQVFSKGKALVVPLNQQQYQLIKASFEIRTEFTDSLFYDVSAFNLAMAHNLPFAALSGKEFNQSALGKMTQGTPPSGDVVGVENPVAYLLPWESSNAMHVLRDLLARGIRVKVANAPITVSSAVGRTDFQRGTLYFSAKNQYLDERSIRGLVAGSAKRNGVTVYGVDSYMTPEGIDLGSPSLSKLKEPKVLLVTGSGVNSYDAGEVWHLLDYRCGMSISMVEWNRIGSIDLSVYNSIVMVDGSYRFSKHETAKLKDWISEGGTLVAMKGAVQWLSQQQLAPVKFKSRYQVLTDNDALTYAQVSKATGAHVIGGAIYRVKADLTHPLLYGFYREEFEVFKKGSLAFEGTTKAIAAPLHYTNSPLIAGYSSPQNIERIKGTPALVVGTVGRGRVICFADNPNFRGFWRGTNRLFINALYFGRLIRSNTTEPVPAKTKRN